jgi:WD40 repeat protein
MPWPLSQDYNEAVQNPHLCFADAELCAGRVAVNALGVPMPRSGNFADVYELHSPFTDSRWAVKCFTRQVPGLGERYAAISDHLRQARPRFAVDFQFLEQGIRVRGQWYPVVKMQWVEGPLLNDFVRDALDRPARLEALAEVWVRLARRLREAGLAHGDLQHGNVLLVPDRNAASLHLRLVDYDGMYVPALAGRRSGEAGHPAYQHPQRLREATYGPEVDRFPLLVIYVALRALMTGGRPLWERYDNGDNLLFREQDLRAPRESRLFWELVRLNDPELRRLADRLSRAAHKPLDQVPHLDELVTPRKEPSPTESHPDVSVPKAVTKGVSAAPPGAAVPWSPQASAPKRTTSVLPPGPAIATDSASRPEPGQRTGLVRTPHLVPIMAAGTALALLGMVLTGLLLAVKGGHELPATERVVGRRPLAVAAKGVPPGPGEFTPEPGTKHEPAPEPEAKPAPITEPRPEPEPKVESPPEPKPEVRPAPRPEPKPERKPEREPEREADPNPPPRPERKPEAEPPPEPAAESRPGKTRVPSEVEQGIAEKVIRGLFKDEYAKHDAAALRALAAKLFQKGLETEDDRCVRFVLFREARDLAARGGDQAAALKAVDQLVSEYAVGALSMKVGVMQALARAADGAAANEALAESALDISRDAAAEDDYDAALQMLEVAEPAVRKAKSGALASRAQAWRKRVEALQKGYADLQKDLDTLSRDPADPRANLAVGKFLCLGKGDWHKGLVLLKRGSDPGFKVVAEKELANPAGAEAQVELADAWYSIAQAERGEEKVAAQQRACKWYQQALPGLRGLTQTRVEKKVEQLSSLVPELKPAVAPRGFLGHTAQVLCVAVSPDGQLGLSGDKEGTVRLWDIETGKELRSFTLGSAPVATVCFSGDGSGVYAAGPSSAEAAKTKSFALRAWNIGGGVRMGMDSTPCSALLMPLVLGLSPAANRVLWIESTGQPAGLHLCKLNTMDLGNVTAGTHPVVEPKAGATSVALSPDGSKALTGGGPRDAALRLWDIQGGSVQAFGGLTTGIQCVALSADTRYGLSGGLDRNVRVWDLTKAWELRTLRGHEGTVTSVAFSPDGRRALSGSQDRTVRLWDVQTGKELARFQGHTEVVHSVVFSPDGRRALSASADKTVRVWELSK